VLYLPSTHAAAGPHPSGVCMMMVVKRNRRYQVHHYENYTGCGGTVKISIVTYSSFHITSGENYHVEAVAELIVATLSGIFLVAFVLFVG
jgi:hypothetical protein